MCGRYMLFDEEQNEELARIIEKISIRLQDNPNAPTLKTGEIFPTDNVPIVVSKDGRQSAHLAKWGFPNFSRPGVIINAKSETLEEKPMFRKSFYERRCLVPANGYYEWKKDGVQKIKYCIRTDKPLLYMAGLYGGYRDKEGKPYTGFVIVTTEPSAAVAEIHDRMPVVFSSEKAAEMWLQAESSIDLKRILVPCEDVFPQAV